MLSAIRKPVFLRHSHCLKSSSSSPHACIVHDSLLITDLDLWVCGDTLVDAVAFEALQLVRPMAKLDHLS